MAIRVVLGPPGAGKTYYLVHHLLHNYARWDEVSDSWQLRPGVQLFANISGLRFGADLDHEIKKAGGIPKFFTIARWKDALAQLRREADDARVVFVIDEAQKYFPRRFFDKDVFLFFQWHRHLGVDVYILTQDVKTLALELRSLAEYIVRARRRSLSVVGEFKYDFLGSEDDREVWYSKVLRRDKKVFAAYQSMLAGEGEGVKRVVWGKVGMFVAAILLSLGLGYYTVSRFWERGARPAVAEASSRDAAPGAAQSAGGGAAPGRAPGERAPSGSREVVAAAVSSSVRVAAVAGSAHRGFVWLQADGYESRVEWEVVRRLCLCDPGNLRIGSTLPFPLSAFSTSRREIRAAAAEAAKPPAPSRAQGAIPLPAGASPWR